MKYADVIVDLSLQKLDRVFQYAVPAPLEDVLLPGMQVTVPFGRGDRKVKGYVTDISDKAKWDPEKTKEIISIEEGSVKIEGQLIALASWMRHVYGSTMNQALNTVLPVKTAVKERSYRTISLSCDMETAQAQRDVFERKHQSARLRLMDALIAEGSLVFPEAGRRYKITSKTVDELVKMGLAVSDEEKLYGEPYSGADLPRETISLNEGQRAIADDIILRMDEGDLRPSLIHGVTGSGKTEIYMELIDAALRGGGEAIVLIPEIALTYQTVMRFYARFGDDISYIHSRLSEGKRFERMEKAKSGRIKVMIGPRSALFTPFANLKIIIIDEEHDGSYKSGASPRYHAREAAIERAGLCGAAVVMGSATPSVDSYSRALSGEFKLYKLENRVMGRSLPEVDTVDLRDELKSGNRSIFSRLLKDLISERLERHEQVMLFLNRRGYAGFVSCRACGNVIKCPHCDVSLTLHTGGFMLCHYCGYKIPEVKRCPSCGSGFIGAFRAGTQQVAAIAQKEFPDARILRMDRDTTGAGGGHEKILKSFADRQADILIGTQMIVKGHDFPGVTLVGVLAADMSLYDGDYRCAEKTFQLLTQAVGRAGRGDLKGRALIQTYNPRHYSIRCAASQDYEGFYAHEIAYRQRGAYPPVSHMTAVGLVSADQDALTGAALFLKNTADAYARARGAGVSVLGPSDASPARINDLNRKVIYLKSESREDLIEIKDLLTDTAGRNGMYEYLNLQFDMDPANPF